jgi:hypothetical protein
MKRYLYFLVLLTAFLLANSLHAQNRMLVFDGVDDIATVPHHNSYDLGTGDFTVEVWMSINSSVPNGYVPIVSSRTAGLQGFLLYVYNGNSLLLQMGGGSNQSYVVSTASLHDGQCHYIAASRSGTNVKFYLDGVYKGTVTGGTNSMTSNGPLYFGYDIFDNYHLAGSMDEVRLWSVARSDADILDYYNTTVNITDAGLLGYWTLDEGTGQTLTDWTNTSNTGVLGSTSSVESSDPIRVNGCDRVITGTLVANQKGDLLTASPNPFTIDTKITINGALANSIAEVYSLEGQLIQTKQVKEANEFQIGAELPVGMYILKILTSSGVQTTRILKN